MAGSEITSADAAKIAANGLKQTDDLTSAARDVGADALPTAPVRPEPAWAGEGGLFLEPDCEPANGSRMR
jgi:hypothetical protein